MLIDSFTQGLPIVILLAVVWFVLSRLPKVDLGFSKSFKRRRLWNWLPLGLTYAFLYMGRYNLTVSKSAFGDLMSNHDFGTIFFVGTVVYGVSFVVNGPLTDKIGGRNTILLAAFGSAAANFLMGLVTYFNFTSHLVVVFSVLYGINMYFQSFGAVSIVKVNASWFHLRERGTFGGIFGILISLGLYFAYDWGGMIVKTFPLPWVFFVPTLLLIGFFILSYVFVCDSPEDAGFPEIDTADASQGELGQPLPLKQVALKMLSNPAIVTIALVEFCSGFLRNAIMQWYVIFSKQTGISAQFVPANWGLLLCCAGILGGVVAGTVSDKVFQSRRGPVSALLYCAMAIGAILALFLLESPYLGWLMVVLSMAIIGVHGMLSGTASMDFGGKRNVGTAVGMIDGLVYLGSGAEALVYGSILPNGEAAKDPHHWVAWPVAMIPVAVVGLLLTTRLWYSFPGGKARNQESP